jgi:CubicO group peptidase (beta-lactamase class C family)
MSVQRQLQLGFKPVADAIRQGKIPGAVLGIVNRENHSALLHGGQSQIVPTMRAMQSDTCFDLASLTKVLFTTPRILMHQLNGAFDLDDPVSSVLRDLRQYDSDCWERQVTFRECLTHQTPFPAVEPLYTYGQTPDLLRAFVLQRQWREGGPVYSDINFILLGLVLERLEQKTIWEMDPGKGFAFNADPENCAATEDCTWRHRVLCGEVHDDNCCALQGAGHAGLFGTADAILNAAHGLLNDTAYPVKVIDLMRTPVTATRAHGWECAYTGWSGGELCSDSTVGHTGFTGTGLWIDFEAGVAWTLLTNRIHPTRHFDSGIAELRRSVGEAILRG